jgi:hypothetical protein
MEMGIQPPESILNGDMQVPERIRLRDLKSPPHRRFDAFQGNLELIYKFEFSLHLSLLSHEEVNLTVA